MKNIVTHDLEELKSDINKIISLNTDGTYSLIRKVEVIVLIDKLINKYRELPILGLENAKRYFSTNSVAYLVYLNGEFIIKTPQEVKEIIRFYKEHDDMMNIAKTIIKDIS